MAGLEPADRGGERTGDRSGRLDARGQLGEAEVGDLGGAVLGDEDVGGLEVAVQQALVVSGGQAPAGLDEALEDPRPRSLGLAQPGAKRPPAHVLHHQHHPGARVVDVVHGHHVGVGEQGHGLGLPHEALVTLGLERVGAQELEGYLALELGVVGPQHLAHAPATDLLEHDVAIDRLAERDGFEPVAQRAPAVTLSRVELAGVARVVRHRPQYRRGRSGPATEVDRGSLVRAGIRSTHGPWAQGPRAKR